MVNVKKTMLVRCDPAMRQLLMHLDEDRILGHHFIVKNLDDRHVLIEADSAKELADKLESLLESEWT
uniref:General transcription and DNA repair factor IIH subunit TFB5 n=1 Tax=Steinernema glaseri TaxID=37863 RepID=A0A1I7Z0U2_9BILA